MEIIVTLGQIDIKRLKQFVDWLEQAPLQLNDLNFSAEVQKGDVSIKIKAPKVNSGVK